MPTLLIMSVIAFRDWSDGRQLATASQYETVRL